MLNKNLFLYDLAVVAIFKDEGRYLKEWLDYHLLAGVEHFYLYNNDSTDNYEEVLAPYIEKNLVTLTDFPGKMMQYPAYNDAINKYRFDCRYMAFIDIDEFIFPKSNRSIVEVVDEILSGIPNAAGLAINWQMFGSNGQETADYSRGVLERFTRRADSTVKIIANDNVEVGNVNVKTIANPRLVQCVANAHCANYFFDKFAVNSNGKCVPHWGNNPVLNDKIVVNHYIVKSREEFFLKSKRGYPNGASAADISFFSNYDHNEEFDDGILKYRAAREKNFSFESDESRISRVINALVQTLMQNSSDDSFVDKLETFLTCRAVAEKFQIKIGEHFAEEYALAWIYQTHIKANLLTCAEIQLFMKELPKILTRPFPICKELKTLTQDNVIPRLCATWKNLGDMKARDDMIYIQQLLRLIK